MYIEPSISARLTENFVFFGSLGVGTIVLEQGTEDVFWGTRARKI